MVKKVYTGAYLLVNEKAKSQFGIIDASANPNGENIRIRICFGREFSKQIEKFEDDSILLKLTLEESESLYQTLMTTSLAIKQLAILSKKGKLTDEAYIDSLE